MSRNPGPQNAEKCSVTTIIYGLQWLFELPWRERMRRDGRLWYRRERNAGLSYTQKTKAACEWSKASVAVWLKYLAWFLYAYYELNESVVEKSQTSLCSMISQFERRTSFTGSCSRREALELGQRRGYVYFPGVQKTSKADLPSGNPIFWIGLLNQGFGAARPAKSDLRSLPLGTSAGAWINDTPVAIKNQQASKYWYRT